MSRLIDVDALRKDYALGERCEQCERYGKKECDYPLYSARDFCGWLDDAPVIDAVPLELLCQWLSENALTSSDEVLDAKEWENKLRAWMEDDGK